MRPLSALPLLLLAALHVYAAAPPAESEAQKQKRLGKVMREVAGSAEYLRSVPKRFAVLKAVAPSAGTVELLVEGEKGPKSWPLAPDAEIKVHGWWGRLDQLAVGDRVWVWFQTSRKGAPVAVAMLADEISQQDIHGLPLPVMKSDGDTLLVRAGKAERSLSLAGSTVWLGERKGAPADIKAGSKVYVQSAAGRARLVADEAGLEVLRAKQKEALRQRWLEEGLPGTVSFVHRFSGEMDIILDHEAIRWGRALQGGDRVSLMSDPPVPAVVKHVRPWRERTLVRLVARSADLTDLRPGERLRLKRPAPAPEVDASPLPPDLDRPRSREERIEWFLCTIYCTCKVHGNVCTGHFYTLASCNPNGCGMPNVMRKKVAGLIEKGLTDKQILQALLEEQGPELLRPHLLP